MRPEEIKHLVSEAKKMAIAGTHQVLGDNYGIKNFFLPIFLNIMNHDTEHTAAYGSISTLLNLVTITSVSTLFQLPSKMSALFSDLNAAMDELERERIKQKIIALIRSACIYSALVIPPLMLPLCFSQSLLTNVFGVNREIAAITQSFLRPYSLSLIATALTVTFGGMIIGTGHTKIFLVGSVLLGASLAATAIFSIQEGLSFNKSLNRLLGFFITEAYASAALYFSYVFFHPDYGMFNLREKFLHEFSFDWESFKELLKDGVTSTLRISCDFLFPFILTTLCARLSKKSEESQAAFSLASQPQWLNNLINVFFALAAGKSLSDAKDEKKVSPNLFKNIAYAGIAVTAAASFIIPATFSLLPRLPAKIFGNNNEAVLTTLDSISAPIALASWLDAFCFTLMFQAQSGWNDFLIGCVSRIAGLVIGLIAAVFFAFTMDMGASGLAWGFPIGMIPTLFMLGKNYFSGIEEIALDKETKRHRWDFYQVPATNSDARVLTEIVSGSPSGNQVDVITSTTLPA